MDSKKAKATGWIHSTNIYEVNVRQYTPEGTFNAFARELPRLRDMGVETLWFMPITPIAEKNKKGSLGSYYACSDYVSINPEFGTLDDFKQLVKQAHAAGFKVIIDWVANHTGWDHVWAKEHPDFYQSDPETKDFKMASGMDDIIELDYSNPELRKAMIDAMKFWVKECDIDGFRCDLASWVEIDFWKEARPAVDAEKPLFWFGEFDELESHDYGKIFDASYSWSWMHKTREYCENHLPLTVLATLLESYQDIGDGSMRTWFTSNHDENSWNGTEYEKYGDRAIPLAVFSITWNGIPLIYSGQELPNKKRLQFFDKDVIEWTGKYGLHDFYKTLLTLRSKHPALKGGDPSITTCRLKTTDDVRIFAYLRKKGKKEVLVLLNLSTLSPLYFGLTDEKVKGVFTNVFTGEKSDIGENRSFKLNASEFLVFEK